MRHELERLEARPQQVVESHVRLISRIVGRALEGDERLRFIANCLTRLRYLDEEAAWRLRAKGSPKKAQSKFAHSVFEAREARCADRASSSATGRRWDSSQRDVTGLDTGCVWEIVLTALRRTCRMPNPSSAGAASRTR